MESTSDSSWHIVSPLTVSNIYLAPTGTSRIILGARGAVLKQVEQVSALLRLTFIPVQGDRRRQIDNKRKGYQTVNKTGDKRRHARPGESENASLLLRNDSQARTCQLLL